MSVVIRIRHCDCCFCFMRGVVSLVLAILISAPAAAIAAPAPVQVQMRNVALHVDATTIVRIVNLRGELISTSPTKPPVFDDRRSFKVRVDSGEIAVDSAALRPNAMSTWATLRLYGQRIWAFVSDDPRDLMYAGDESWRPAVLDVGQDDYYHAHILGCRELAESPYLERNIQHPTEKLSVSVVGPGRVVSTPAGVGCKPRCSASRLFALPLASRIFFPANQTIHQPVFEKRVSFIIFVPSSRDFIHGQITSVLLDVGNSYVEITKDSDSRLREVFHEFVDMLGNRGGN
jgi:hypothetical protein